MNEPQIILPRLITRGFCKLHPDWVFLYGHDVNEKGMEGHGWIHGEPNAIQIYTMYKFCPSSHRLFTDNDTVAWELVRKSLEQFKHIKRPIFPLRKLGEGCSRMKELAPRLYALMTEEINRVKYPNIKWDYTL